MAVEVRLPDLGESITHAKLTTWLKSQGDQVRHGEAIAEVETDKTNVEIEAPVSGTLVRIDVEPGTDGVAIATVLALIAEAGSEEEQASAAAGAAKPIREEATLTDLEPDPPVRSSTSDQAIQEVPARLGESLAANRPIDASPLAQRMAYAAGIPLDSIAGTGPGGRITKQDVDARLRPELSRPAPALVPSPPLRDEEGHSYDVTPLSPMRRVTAERLTHAKQTIPHFYLQTDCHVDAVSQMRKELNGRRDTKMSVTAFAIRAIALALVDVPAANASWVDGMVRIHHGADIAVAVETSSGLIAPVIRGAGGKSLSAVNEELRSLAERARGGKLKPDDYTGGTFTLSNLGMYGVTGIFPIINPPQSCILGIGAAERRAIVRGDAVVAGEVMTCTLSADHRAIDGATGARFLAAFRRLIEDPWALVL